MTSALNIVLGNLLTSKLFTGVRKTIKFSTYYKAKNLVIKYLSETRVWYMTWKKKQNKTKLQSGNWFYKQN